MKQKGELSRGAKLKLNSVAALVNQIVVIIHGLILPRLYINCFGSKTYGLTSSITQFLGVVSLMELGMGAVVQSALYFPLAHNDNVKISQIVKSAERFFSKIGLALAGYTVVLAFVYPGFINKDFSWFFEASLIIIVSISSLAEYFFGITYRLLVVADQRGYINCLIQCTSYIVNIIVCTILMKYGHTIHVVKFASAVVFLLKPIVLMRYVRRKYYINKDISYTEEPIKQKWNGVAQHIAYYVTQHTDILVLTLFSSLENVSVYSVYNIVTNGISTLIYSLNNGTQALLGNMLARREDRELVDFFGKLEWTIHNIVVFFYACVGILIVSFVKVYTIGVNDAEYMQPLFAAVFTLSSAVYCLRLPYNMMVNAAGHYKQTQMSSIIEMCLNVGITLTLVPKFGLVGAAMGTLFALSYRTVYLAKYISKNIITHDFKNFVRRIAKDICIAALIIISTLNIKMQDISYTSWIIMAFKVAFVACIELIGFNLIFDKRFMTTMLKKRKDKSGGQK